MSQDIKELGLECFNEHIKGNKTARNEKLMQLREEIAKELGDDFIQGNILNTEVAPAMHDGKMLFPTIKFAVKKNEDDDISRFAWRMKEVFGINSTPYVVGYEDESIAVLDITEYWKNILIEKDTLGSSISTDLIDIFSSIHFKQWCDWSKDIADLLSSCDITMQKVIEDYDNEKDMSSILQEQWIAIKEISKLLIEWHNKWNKEYKDLSDEDKAMFKKYALETMNSYINWHFVHTITP